MGRIFFQCASSGFRLVEGACIIQMQRVLQEEGLYPFRVDGIFGGKTERAMQDYQQNHHLPSTGKIDAETWAKAISPNPPGLMDRCLQLTGAFEGHGFTKIAGNFDGAGLTWGIIGFTLSNGELQKVLREVQETAPELIPQAFGDLTDILLENLDAPRNQQMDWANEISLGTSGQRVEPEWEEAFKNLGEFPQVQAIQVKRVKKYWDIAKRDAARFELASELGMALCFDIAVQNGGVDGTEEEMIRQKLTDDPPTTEKDVRIIIANVVADNTRNRRFVEDVRHRKLTIATGLGEVHGDRYQVRVWGLDEFPMG